MPHKLPLKSDPLKLIIMGMSDIENYSYWEYDNDIVIYLEIWET